MPDTGAPWNIPYVAPSDLVRDYPSDSEDLADAIALGLSEAQNAGIGTNVVQAVKTDVFNSSSTSYVAVTGMSATITPTSNTSKVLVLVSMNVRGRYNVSFRLLRGASVIGNDPWKVGGQGNIVSNNQLTTLVAGAYLDSPATDSATTYSIEGKHSLSAAWIVNEDNDSVTMSAELTLIEVKA